MITGVFAGIAWAIATSVLGIVLGRSPFVSTSHAIFLAPFIATFLHDACSFLFMLAYNTIKGNLKDLLKVFRSKNFRWVVIASVVGGPIGMTGYVMAVNYMGASVGAVASAIYPAIGALLAWALLKEKVTWYQWLFLFCTLLGVYGLSYSPNINIENFWLGLLGTLMCAVGWGIEAVILAKCFKDSAIKNEYALNIRQMASALIYGTIIIPVLNGWDFTISIVIGESVMLLPMIAIASLSATVSYILYYKTINKIGASKAMALNITYTAWAIFFEVLMLRNFNILEPFTIMCAIVIVVCGILAATDFKNIFSNCKKK